MRGYRLTVSGLKGGHSGVDIHLGRANANKLMNRLLWHASKSFGLRIAEIDGGGLRNAIPRESFAVVAVPESQESNFKLWLQETTETIRNEYQTTDPEARIVAHPTDCPKAVIPTSLQRSLLGTLYAAPCGIHRMSPDMEGLVQSSNNLARVQVQDGEVGIHCLTRSSVNSERDDLANAIMAVLELTGAEVNASGAYPGWQPAPSSEIVTLMSTLYEELFGQSAHVAACHGGLECGILGHNYPELDMISFGPNIENPHSPDERTQISSVQKYWKFLIETLKQIPQAAE